MNIAIILAGGVGSRFGANKPKQFVEVLGKPVIAYTIDTFQKCKDIDAIEVVCVEAYIDYMYQIKEQYSFDKIKWITKGGKDFQQSVYNGINNLENKIDDEDIVVIHFAASPFIENDIIEDNIRVCKKKGNAISSTDFYLLPGIKKSDSSVDDKLNYSDEYINRDRIACMNTPHSFRYRFIIDMYKEAIETGVISKVEPHTTTLMYALKKNIYFSKGSQTNIKITRQEDIYLFEGYVLMKRKNAKRENF